MDFSLNIPINEVSFGQVSLQLLRELHVLGEQPNIFPIGGQVKLTGQVSQDFANWLTSCINKATKFHKRTTPTFKLWHLSGGLESYSNNQILYTFYELDSPTDDEVNVVNQNRKVLFSSTFSRGIFSRYVDEEKTGVLFPAFDKANFHPTSGRAYEDRITFNILGKFEKRKHHAKAIKAWVSKYGGNKKYYLKCAIQNPFWRDENEARASYASCFNGPKPFNVDFFGFMDPPSYNKFLNDTDVVLGVSGGEGWGLPEFTSVALGKQAVILNAHAYKDWATADKAVLLEPSGKEEAYDNKFFIKGQSFNQGNIFTFDDNQFIAACEKSVEAFSASKTNWKGYELQHAFNSKLFANKVIDQIKSIS